MQSQFQSQMQSQGLALPLEHLVGPSACLKLGHLTLFHEQPVVSPAKPPRKPNSEVNDPIYLMTLTIPKLFLRPYQVTWDATVFGVFNPDFPLYIKHKDLSEIAHGGQCLSISVLQLWILPDNYLKGIINRQKGSTECGYYVMHWMSTIILGSFRNNWEAYFNNPRPLEPERLKALARGHRGILVPSMEVDYATHYPWAKEEVIKARSMYYDWPSLERVRDDFVLTIDGYDENVIIEPCLTPRIIELEYRWVDLRVYIERTRRKAMAPLKKDKVEKLKADLAAAN
ncbi:hypothetical protein HKD37_20G055714 [Glycine soja]